MVDKNYPTVFFNFFYFFGKTSPTSPNYSRSKMKLIILLVALATGAYATESKPASECITDYALNDNKGCIALSEFGQCVATAPKSE